MKITYSIIGWLLLAAFAPLQARPVRLLGYVLDADNRGIDLANVFLLEDQSIGTTTDRNGYFDFTVELTDTVTVVFSMVGYETLRQQVFTPRDAMHLRVVLPTSAQLLEEVTVRGQHAAGATMQQGDVAQVRTMPSAAGGGIESLLITFAGVSQNNELSSQYNVRGGSFDENSVYVNGIEVHRPLLIRSGQQEGLSFVNPDMVRSLQFSAGGFDARYGDKMSSVLDIRYKRPERFESHLYAALLGAGAYVGWGDSTQSQMHGIRYKTSKYMLGALETAGNYQPNFVDYQTQMTWSIGPQRAWEIRLLGNVSQNTYTFIPDSISSSFGSLNQALNKTIWYEGQEKDVFRTAFAAVGTEGKISPNIRIGFDISGFYTYEQETYDISSEYVLSEKPLDGSQSSVVSGQSSGISGQTSGSVLGTGNYHEHARNTLRAGVVTLAHHGTWTQGENRLHWGVSAQLETIADNLSEWEWRDSMGYSLPHSEQSMDLYYALKGSHTMLSGRFQGFAENTYRWSTDQGKVYLTAGLRLNYWTYTRELLPSPRLSVSWMPGIKQDLTLRASTGIYFQSPFYKELRRMVTDPDGVTRIELNNHLPAQRSYQLVLGSDYYFRAWGRPFKFTAEAYGKYIDRLESYTVDNVRIRYSGDIDAKGYTIGLDLKLHGELVPGADSWISFSTMRSRMQMNDDPYHRGWFPTPQEQRYNVTMYFQDYIPKLPQYRLHLKFVFADGLPFGYPRSEQMRYLGHLPAYRRIDIGASRIFSAATDRWMQGSKTVESWGIYFEVFNLVGWKNVNSYYWVTDANGQQWASPNYLTGRMFNLKLDINLK